MKLTVYKNNENIFKIIESRIIASGEKSNNGIIALELTGKLILPGFFFPRKYSQSSHIQKIRLIYEAVLLNL